MQNGPEKDVGVSAWLSRLEDIHLSPLDLLPHADIREKLVELALFGVPAGIPPAAASSLQAIKDALAKESVSDLQVVVFGGGTGLSTIIGGDSRAVSWTKDPFSGLKKLFPKTRSIVCITDDGGSTGEMLKDLPLIALGDIRHVLLSSIQLAKLQDLYGLSVEQAGMCIDVIGRIFNYRFDSCPAGSNQLLEDCGFSEQNILPVAVAGFLERAVENLFTDSRLRITLQRPQCLGNLILASSVYEQIPSHFSAEELLEEDELLRQNLARGITSLCVILGADEQAVIPCTTIPAQLSVRYTNGVQVTGEHKSGDAQRNYPVEHVSVNFCKEPILGDDIKSLIASADIMIMAPGSLYSSLIPIFQIPGIAEAVKENQNALKILVSNLWVQAGETDLSINEPDRKFLLSDLLQAYEQNIPGGTTGMFDKVICLSFKDVPATVIQNYAVEGKIPIYLDREKVREHGIVPLECSIYSTAALRDLGVIRHDPQQFAHVIQTLWASFIHLPSPALPHTYSNLKAGSYKKHQTGMMNPSQRFKKIGEHLAGISIELSSDTVNAKQVREILHRILWDHKDIPLTHLQFVKGIQCIPTVDWKRNQNWDRVYSFYDPFDGCIKIRQDQFASETYLEIAFLVALGQSLLGNYAKSKAITPLENGGEFMGKAYHLHVRSCTERNCFFKDNDLAHFLALSRMIQDPEDPEHFTRVVNGNEGFTPPGLLFGLTYAWYLDNRFATHIEYKMAVIRVAHSDLIPEQVRMRSRREKLTDFFREVVFGHPPVHP